MYQQPNFNQLPSNKKRYVSVILYVVLATVILFMAGRFGGGSNEIDISNGDSQNLWEKVTGLFNLSKDKEPTIDDDPEYIMPKDDKNRWDILLLGIRGEDDENAEDGGALLTDTMMVLSYDQITKKISLVSIPRDLYVRIYGTKKDKINSAYEVGLLRKNGLGFTRKLISRVTGIYIDNALVINFSSFKKIVDDLGGVDVTLEQPFSEKQQWGYEFSLPAGPNHLDGQTALYYVRSRFSSSDFDRAQRQQKVIVAIKDKILGLNLISDPIKTLTIINTLRTNIETDLNIWDTGGLIDIAKQFDGATGKINRYTITTENLVYESRIQTEAGNLYILLPAEDNLQGIKQLFQDILK